MPVKKVSIWELRSLSKKGGVGGRKFDDCIPWVFGGNSNGFVTPQVDDTNADSSMDSLTKASSEEEDVTFDGRSPKLQGNRILDIIRWHKYNSDKSRRYTHTAKRQELSPQHWGTPTYTQYTRGIVCVQRAEGGPSTRPLWRPPPVRRSIWARAIERETLTCMP